MGQQEAKQKRPGALAGLTVEVEAAGLAGCYAGWLLHGLGADVRFELGPALTGRDLPVVDWLTRPAEGAPGAAPVHQRMLIVDAGERLTAEHRTRIDAARAADPDVLAVAISPFGLDGPWAERRATGEEIQALAGLSSVSAFAEEPPRGVRGHLAELAGGAAAALAAAIAVFGAGRGSAARLADVALLDVVIGLQGSRGPIEYSNTGLINSRVSAARQGLWGYLPCSDGFLTAFLNISSWQEALDFLQLDPVALPRENWDVEAAVRRLDPVVVGAVSNAMLAHDRAYWVERGIATRIPVMPVNAPEELSDDVQLRARGFWQAGSGPDEVEPAPFFRSPVAWREGAAQGDAPAAARLRPNEPPLGGVNVVELGLAWSAPVAAELLAMFGATVVKLESPGRLDTARVTPVLDLVLRHPWYEYSTNQHPVNVGKLHFALDLAGEGADEVRDRLVRWADVLLTNYSPRAVQNLGLDGDTVLAVNPRCVTANSSAFGFSGPRKSWVAYGTGVEGASGGAMMNGEGGQPFPSAIVNPDIFAALHQCLGVVAALVERERTGAGVAIEVSQFEAGAILAAEPILVAGRPGSSAVDDDRRTLVLQCAGDDEWVCLTLAGERDRRALAAVAGESADDMRGLERWARGQDRFVAADALAAAGLAAAPVLFNSEVAQLDHLHQRGFFNEWSNERFGRRWAMGRWFRFEGLPAPRLRPFQTFGEGNVEVLTLLGFEPAAIARLEAAGTIATKPRNAVEVRALPDPVPDLLAVGLIRGREAEYRERCGLE